VWTSVGLIAGGTLLLLLVSPLNRDKRPEKATWLNIRDPKLFGNTVIGGIIGVAAIIYGIGSLLT
jgi:hypothetical protein